MKNFNLSKVKKIAVTGGKGGTGKSAFAVLFANNLVRKNKKVILVDCDVECPNDYLILGQKKGILQDRVYANFPVFKKEKCKKCGLCARSCKEHAIFMPPNGYPVFIEELCSGCGVCWNVCPYGAILPQKKETGKIFLNKIKNNLYLLTGFAQAGLQETGPVALRTKAFSLSLAKKVKADYLIFDTAAGTHCPVIAALMGSNMAYAVTEPTPMGAHDLALILELCQKLNIQTKVILNRADLGNKALIENIIKKFGTVIEKEIHFSESLLKAYSRGKMLDFSI